MSIDTSCLVSVIRNTSGGALKIAIIPPHGADMANDEEVTISGNAVDAIRQYFGQRGVNAFYDLLESETLTLVSTPAPILQDIDTEASKMLVLDGGVLTVADPCWTESLSA